MFKKRKRCGWDCKQHSEKVVILEKNQLLMRLVRLWTWLVRWRSIIICFPTFTPIFFHHLCSLLTKHWPPWIGCCPSLFRTTQGERLCSKACACFTRAGAAAVRSQQAPCCQPYITVWFWPRSLTCAVVCFLECNHSFNNTGPDLKEHKQSDQGCTSSMHTR